MRLAISNTKRHGLAGRPDLAALAMLLLACLPLRSIAQQPGQKTFASPEAATTALVTAVKSDDEASLLGLLGAKGKALVSSGDAAEDAESRANFVARYDEMHRLVNEPDGTVTLYIGARNWPTPIPLVHKGDSWYFDTDAGKQEILFRRVGGNEVSTIRVCQQLVAAENQYHDAQHGEYASKIFSDQGQHDGLYWPAAAGEAQSPIGPLVASAFDERGEGGGNSAAIPFRGYYFHWLSMQGKNAPGGAKRYVMDGKMTEGFAFVAYPAEYRSSGVMTFIVGRDGIVYEKDLGRNTRVIAEALKKYDPDATWHAVQEPELESARE